METTTEKNKKDGVRTFWYPIEREEPLPDEYYESMFEKTAQSPALKGKLLKRPQNHYNRVLHRLGKRLGKPALDRLLCMFREDNLQLLNERQRYNHQSRP